MISLTLSLLSCATSSFRQVYRPISINRPVYLRLGAEQGRVEVTHYTSAAEIRTYDKKGGVKVEKEHVNFDIEDEVLFVDRNLARIHKLVTSKNKIGNIKLTDFAFPENGKKLAFVFYPNAEVQYVEKVLKNSIFYLPPVSLPLGKVKKGSTWNLSRTWMTQGNLVPLNIQLVSILKSFYQCGKSDRCADIEISGRVKVAGIDRKKIDLESRISGRILFSIDRGVVIWSSLLSSEKLTTKDSQIEIKTCLESLLTSPEKIDLPIPITCKLSGKEIPLLPSSFR